MGVLVLNKVWSAALLRQCYLEAGERDCEINKKNPGLESILQYFFLHFKGCIFQTVSCTHIGSPNNLSLQQMQIKIHRSLLMGRCTYFFCFCGTAANDVINIFIINNVLLPSSASHLLLIRTITIMIYGLQSAHHTDTCSSPPPQLKINTFFHTQANGKIPCAGASGFQKNYFQNITMNNQRPTYNLFNPRCIYVIEF